MKTKRKEAVLIGYKLLYDKTGKLITERVTTDIKELEKYLSRADFNLLRVVLRECTVELDKIHNYIESNLDCRKISE